MKSTLLILIVATFIVATAHAGTTNDAATNAAPSPATTNAPTKGEEVEVREAKLLQYVIKNLEIVPSPTRWDNFWFDSETGQREKRERVGYSFLSSADGKISVWVGMENSFPVGTRGGEPPPKTIIPFLGLKFRL